MVGGQKDEQGGNGGGNVENGPLAEFLILGGSFRGGSFYGGRLLRGEEGVAGETGEVSSSGPRRGSISPMGYRPFFIDG